jgi:signal transduction histidine kinase
VLVREALRSVEQKDLLQRIDCALHDLCQPLTVLQCRLALGEMIDEPDAMREAIREALQECLRLNQTVDTIRAMLREMTADQKHEGEW